MGGKKTESCGRCAMSTVVDVASSDEEGEAESNRDPFGDDAIEIDDETLRRMSPGAWASRLTTRLDDIAHRFIYGR
ncbi:hypothetical protein GS429_13675 [Natronorubrum sp. JWXQ-INN-674]|uniref:Uncharacterized protein n=1 Tax=Natronorubrum halalkaliphilum TaxID=2691917 RepID=A0A6B0VNN9_9EURY|nr:hypothetical protein [Natronorubrum halalkaliphilum]MXV63098.1 hypothetical protein [Natronorubrum halalkaliphilum]